MGKRERKGWNVVCGFVMGSARVLPRRIIGVKAILFPPSVAALKPSFRRRVEGE